MMSSIAEVTERALRAIDSIGAEPKIARLEEERALRMAEQGQRAPFRFRMDSLILPDTAIEEMNRMGREMNAIMGVDLGKPFQPPPPAVAPVPQSSPVLAPELDPELEEHARLAAKLGVAARPPIAKLKLQAVLAELGISCYDLAAVKAYMDSLAAQKPDTGWAWLFARKTEAPDTLATLATKRWNNWVDPFSNMPRRMSFENGCVIPAHYTERIPLPVLMTMDRLLDRMGDTISFQIGTTVDMAEVRAAFEDPFLAVSAKDEPSEMFIIERWDEPGFRGVKA